VLPVSGLVHQVSDWGSGADAYFGWMREGSEPDRRLEGEYPLWSLTDELDPAAAGPAAHFDRNATTPVTDLVH
jgi:hypothetical protein